MSTDSLTRVGVLERVHELARLAPSARTIIGLARNEGSNTRQLASVCESDLALAARILALVNSRFLGCRQPVTSVLQGAVIIGINRLRNFSFAAALTDLFAELEPAIDLDRYWQHSFKAAALARLLGTRLNGALAEDLFLAGLAHDCAVPLLAAADPERYPKILSEAPEGRLAESERRVFGFDHADAGREVLLEWGIAEPVAGAVGRHTEPPASDPPATDAEILRECLKAATRMAHACGKAGAELVPLSLELPPWLGPADETFRRDAAAALRAGEEMHRILVLLPVTPRRRQDSSRSRGRPD